MGFTKEQREEKKRMMEAQGESDTSVEIETAVADAPTTKPVPKKHDLGHNKQYTRYQVQVTPILVNRFGSQVFDRFEIIMQQKLLTNIRIEPKRAEQLNKKMHTTNHILIEDGGKMPIKVIRKLREDGDLEINGGYIDTYIYE